MLTAAEGPRRRRRHGSAASTPRVSRACDPRGMHQDSPGAARRARLAAAKLYLVLPSAPADASADERAAHAARLEDIARAALGGGVDAVQLREKRIADTELLADTVLLALARELARLCGQAGALFIVNDSPRL